MSKKIKIYSILIAILILLIGGFLFWKLGSRSIEIKGPGGDETENIIFNPVNKGEVSPITGLECDNYDRRFIAVMLAMDPVTRPLSGISFADLVIEMPVITESITRLMAVYICEDPAEIGSLRSSRHDFIPLAMGLDAIYSHWGGSHYALDRLDNGIMDNIDAMKNPYNAYWRKSGVPMPHDGFTSMARLVNAASKLGYRLINKFEGYPHIQNPKPKTQNPKSRLTIGYGGNYQVYYEYNSETNSYKRWRGGTPEIDKLNKKQVEVQNVVVMRANSRMIELPDYNDVDVEGTGTAVAYRNGEEIRGIWEKEGHYQSTKLHFLDNSGKEIEFVPGKVWIEIIEPNREVKWETI